MPIFGHSKFLPVFLYQKGFNKFRMHIFGHSKFIPVFLGKIVGKNLEQPFLAIPNLYQSFWGKLSEKIWNGHFLSFQIYTSFGHSKFIPVFWGKIVRKKFGMATLIECNGLESNEICTFLDFYSEI